MKEYLEKCLRQNINIIENKDLYNNLPLKFKGQYTIYNVFSNQIEWIVVKPNLSVHLNELRRDQKQLQKLTHLNVALYFDRLNTYTKNVLLDEGIPFIIGDKQLYLPFYGVSLAEKDNRKLAPVQTISFLTQKLLLLALYEKWENMNVTKIAKKLDVSKMSITRCFDEIEYLGLDILSTSKSSRMIHVKDDGKILFEKIKRYLRNPVITKYVFNKDLQLEKIAGISALAEYSLLEDNAYPTYAILKKDLKNIDFENAVVYEDEDIGCVALELGYFIDCFKNSVADPITVYLSLSENELNDERIEISVREMMEEYVW